MPNSTDDAINAYIKKGHSAEDARDFATDFIQNSRWEEYQHGYSEAIQDFERGKTLPKTFTYIEPEDEPEQMDYKIGAEFSADRQINEYEDENIYIPSSYYCLLKCIDKLYSITLKKNVALNSMTIRTYRKIMKENEIKDYPRIYKYLNNGYKLITKQDKNINNSAILLIRLKKSFYHAVLIKDKNQLNKRSLNYVEYVEVIKKLSYFENKELTDDFTQIKPFKTQERASSIIVYDIETYAELRDEPEKVMVEVIEGKKVISQCDRVKKVKQLIPYGVCWNEINLTDNTKNNDDAKFNIGNDCLESFINNLITHCKNNPNFYYGTKNEVYIYAHYGGNFDNIFIKRLKNIKFISEISKGSTIKNLVAEKDGIILNFRDSFNYVSMPLKDACKAFEIKNSKLEFNIVDKSREWYDINNSFNNVGVASNLDWVRYLKYDVLALGEIMYKFNNFIVETYNFDIVNSLGNPSLSFKIALKNCVHLSNTYIAKGSLNQKFIRRSVHGGRILHFKKLFEYTPENGGMISIDCNSLYPTAMKIGNFPIGPPIVMNDVKISNLNTSLQPCGNDSVECLYYLFENNLHFIAEIEFETPNYQYNIHPYKSEKGALLYTNSGVGSVLTDIYTSIDIAEMIKDGIKIIKCHRLIYWTRSANIFENLISNLYNTRKEYKNSGNCLEIVIKLIMNSLYGKMLEAINEKKYYRQTFNPDDNYTNVKILKNGQYLITEKLETELTYKPTYLGSFILSYARAIMNETIRKIRPENIYYSDTDSIYLTIADFKKAGIKESGELGGFKNDYGAGVIIKKAIFLDVKRYYLLIEDHAKTKCKVKFNGLNFRGANWVADWMRKENKTEIELLEDLFRWFYENPKAINNNMAINCVVDKWRRLTDSIEISNKNMYFQISPDMRGMWNNDIYHALKFDESRPVAQISNATTLNFGKGEPHYYLGREAFRSSTPLINTENKNIVIDTKHLKKGFDKFGAFYATTKGRILKQQNGIYYSIDNYGVNKVVENCEASDLIHLIIALSNSYKFCQQKINNDDALKIKSLLFDMVNKFCDTL